MEIAEKYKDVNFYGARKYFPSKNYTSFHEKNIPDI